MKIVLTPHKHPTGNVGHLHDHPQGCHDTRTQDCSSDCVEQSKFGSPTSTRHDMAPLTNALAWK